jgi:hypothetical protein
MLIHARDGDGGDSTSVECLFSLPPRSYRVVEEEDEEEEEEEEE